ncbi:MAG: WXG100 family type VII secretion target [Anaerolineae bacterium]|jgi:WXG100 family type VII secretion target
MRIQVHPDSLREVARLFAHQSEAIKEIEGELHRAMSGLDTWAWDGHSRARAEPLLGQVRPSGRHVAERLEELARKLQYAANEFEATDTQAAQKFAPSSIRQAFPAESRFSLTAAMIGIWGSFSLSTISLTARGVRTLAVVDSVLNAPTLSGYTGVTDLALKGVIRAPKHWPFWVGVGGELIAEIGENWNEFGGDIPRVATVVVIESALGVGLSMAGAFAFAWIGGAVGTAIGGPVGAVIGAKVGSIIGGWLGSKAAEWLEQRPIGGQSAAQWVEDQIFQAPGYGVDRVLLPFVNSIARPAF